jgi:pectate lyase
MTYRVLILVIMLLKLIPVSSQTGVAGERALAFPGAEGFGKYVTGGRGGKILVVTNLNNDGPGSLRAAVHSNKPAIIVFRVSGTIHLESDLVIHSDKTIAGQSAPGDGICVADFPVALGGDNIIIRFMRFRLETGSRDKEWLTVKV